VASFPDIPKIKGQIRRAEQVVTNIRMFYDLARGRPIYLNRIYIRPAKLLERVADIVAGHTHFAIDPSRGIQFSLDEASFRVLDGSNAIVRLDLELLDQMVDDLLDNAEKYGDPRTTVTVRAGLVQKGQAAFISIANSGKQTPITALLAKTLAERGQRGDVAVWRKQEGSGLGLYIVREILAAHGGRLEIYPTTDQHITEFRLVFPTSAQGQL
jgi:signal transduction histidine kinase